MDDVLKKFRSRIEDLARKISKYSPQQESAIKDEIKNLYVDIANAVKNLTDAQNKLRALASDFKRRKSSQTEVAKFYSFVKSKTSAELDLATLIDRAWNLIVMEDYKEAIKVLKKILDIDPKNVKGLGFMGLVFMNEGLYDDAMLYFQKVLLIEPHNPFALNNLGYICYKKGIWGEAIEHLTKVAKQTADRMAVLYAKYYLGLVYYERSMIPDAIKFFEEALKSGPNLQEAYYYLGLSETKRYGFKEAVEYFAKCIKIDKKSKYGQLANEEMEKIKMLIEPQRISDKKRKP
jgi:tetratricopeptide (TPR) repeat protein